MRALLRIGALAAGAIFLVGCAPASETDEDVGAGERKLPEGVNQLAVHASETDWTPCAPSLPAGCEIALLEGDPQAEGFFTVRFRLSDEFAMPPHTHPKEERVTILSGRMSVAFGEQPARRDAATFSDGDYYVNARDKVHAVWADEMSVIQISGIGPWEADFVASRD